MTEDHSSPLPIMNWLSSQAQELGQSLKNKTLPKHRRKEARKLLGRAWQLEQEETPDPQAALQLVRQMDTLCTVPGPGVFAQAHHKRFDSLWPLRLRCTRPHTWAVHAVDKVNAFCAHRDERTDALWAMLSPNDEDQEPGRTSLRVGHAEFDIVEKQGST